MLSAQPPPGPTQFPLLSSSSSCFKPLPSLSLRSFVKKYHRTTTCLPPCPLVIHSTDHKREGVDSYQVDEYGPCEDLFAPWTKDALRAAAGQHLVNVQMLRHIKDGKMQRFGSAEMSLEEFIDICEQAEDGSECLKEDSTKVLYYLHNFDLFHCIPHLSEHLMKHHPLLRDFHPGTTIKLLLCPQGWIKSNLILICQRRCKYTLWSVHWNKWNKNASPSGWQVFHGLNFC